MSEVRQQQEDRTVTVPPGTTVKVEAQQVIHQESQCNPSWTFAVGAAFACEDESVTARRIAYAFARLDLLQLEPVLSSLIARFRCCGGPSKSIAALLFDAGSACFVIFHLLGTLNSMLQRLVAALSWSLLSRQ
jgi:hypothetical protein